LRPFARASPPSSLEQKRRRSAAAAGVDAGFEERAYRGVIGCRERDA
jgi:hypothetical protein